MNEAAKPGEYEESYGLTAVAGETVIQLIDALARAGKEHDRFITLTITMTSNDPVSDG